MTELLFRAWRFVLRRERWTDEIDLGMMLPESETCCCFPPGGSFHIMVPVASYTCRLSLCVLFGELGSWEGIRALRERKEAGFPERAVVEQIRNSRFVWSALLPRTTMCRRRVLVECEIESLPCLECCGRYRYCRHPMIYLCLHSSSHYCTLAFIDRI